MRLADSLLLLLLGVAMGGILTLVAVNERCEYIKQEVANAISR